MDAPVPTAVVGDRKRVVLEEDRRAKQGVWLLLASLGVFFFSSLILFVVYVAMRVGHQGPDALHYLLPRSFIASTMLLIAVSLSLHYAVIAARFDQTQQVLRLSILAMVFAMIFFAVQSEGMYVLMNRSLAASSASFSVYPLTFVLAFVHAMHVVGGVVSLVSVIANASRKAYDHERHFGLEFCALYWHFLDLVWVVMMIGFGISVYLIQSAAITK